MKYHSLNTTKLGHPSDDFTQVDLFTHDNLTFDIKELLRFKELKDVIITGYNIKNIELLKKFDLNILSLKRCNLTDIEFCRSMNIEFLSLINNHINEWKALRSLSNLKYMYADPDIEDISIYLPVRGIKYNTKDYTENEIRKMIFDNRINRLT